MDVAKDVTSERQFVQIEPGTQARIELDLGSMTVCKSFIENELSSVDERASREFEYLQKFSNALEGQPFVNCPRPVDVDPTAGKVWMEYCHGQRLDRMLADPESRIDAELDHIAEQIALALRTFVDVFNEPYYDFTTHNMLYDAATRTLGLVDYTHPDTIYFDFDPDLVQYDLSLGNFIASTTYHTVRRRTWRNFGYWRRQRRVTSGLIRRIRPHSTLNPATIMRVQAEKYASLTGYGSRTRILWFSTIGRVIYRWRVTSLIRSIGGG